jgi:hypothetical protein
VTYCDLPAQARLLLFFVQLDAAGGLPRLAATGTLRGADPDRVILKKIVLTGGATTPS